MAREPVTMTPAPSESSSAWSRALTMVCGVFLIAVLTPLAQFLTMMTLTSDAEVATPVGWAVGAVVSLVLVGAVLRWLLKIRLVSRANLVILYCMLTVSVPVMNIGLVRPCYLSMRSVIQEYLVMAREDHRTAYNALHPSWFPVVPTVDGLAWNKADRLLRLLTDDTVVNKRLQAERAVKSALDQESLRLGQVAAGGVVTIDPLSDDNRESLARRIDDLGLDQVTALKANKNLEAAIGSLGLATVIESELASKSAASTAAADSLKQLLPGTDERVAGMLPHNLKRMDVSSQRRIESMLRDMAGTDRAALERQVSQLQDRLPELMRLTGLLGELDYKAVRRFLQELLMAQYEKSDRAQLDAARHDFVYRLGRVERNALMRHDGKTDDAPNQDLIGMSEGLWTSPEAKRLAEQRSFMENVTAVAAVLPWHLWVGPMILWGVLFTCIFLFLMCVAEWLRRKWVDRENLAFPLVEVIDNVIRHDARLETASDVLHPEPRRRLFSVVFVAGLVVGLAMLSLEAMGHYQLLLKERPVTFFNVSQQVLTKGVLQEMNKVYFVMSPIVIGLLFLVSLEISFSIWTIFLVYSVVVVAVKNSGLDLVDKGYTGWAGSEVYPFPTEQLVGASLLFAAVTLWKTWGAGRVGNGDGKAVGAGGDFIPNRVNQAGLVVLPLAMLALAWHMGIANIPLLAVTGVLLMALTIAAARARAETGLHTHHVTYEFSKLPIVLGMTGATGASVYTRFINIAFVPITLLFRSLGQLLENIELARRHKVRYQTVAVAGLIAFLTALAVGLMSFLMMSYYFGGEFLGEKVFPKQGPSPSGIAQYPLWVAHFLGEVGLDKFTEVHWLRICFVVVGAAVFGSLYYLRNRFIRFPIHPLGYFLVLGSIYYSWVSPYIRGNPEAGPLDTSWLWGSALVAWLLKKLIVKYGGMNTYKQAKPFFIGLVVGAVFAVFAWGVTDLACSLAAQHTDSPSPFVQKFTDRPPFSSWYY